MRDSAATRLTCHSRAHPGVRPLLPTNRGQTTFALQQGSDHFLAPLTAFEHEQCS